MTVTPEQAHEMAEKYTQAWCSHVPEAVASHYAEDGEIVINGGESSAGRAAVAEMARGFFDEFPDFVVKMDDVRTSGTHTIFLWTLEGTNTGSGGTGNRVKISGWEYWRLTEDGHVAESVGHFDAADYQRQLEGK